MSMGMGGPPWRHLRSDRSAVESKLERKTVRRVLAFAGPHRRLIGAFLGGHGRRRRARGGPAPAAQGDHRRRRQLRRHVAGRLARRPGGGRGGRRRRLRPHHRVAVQPHRRGPDLRPPHPGLRPRAAPVARVLHPHPDRRPGEPAQQRRHRRPAGVHLDAAGHRLQHHRGDRRRRDDALPQLAGDGAVPRAVPDPAARLAPGRAPGSPTCPARRWTATPTSATP